MNYKLRHKQFLLFMLVGSFSGVVNFIFRIVVNRWVSFSVAITLAYLVGMLTAFVLSKIFVFSKTDLPIHRMFATYTIINLLGLMQTLFISLMLADYIFPTLHIERYAHDIAHAVGLIAPVYISYLGHRKYTFR